MAIRDTAETNLMATIKKIKTEEIIRKINKESQKRLLKQFRHRKKIWRSNISKPSILLCLMILLVFQLIAGVFLFPPIKEVKASPGWLAGWSYRRAITISNGGPALNNYQVLFTLDTQSLISAGKMRNDCGDIRVTDSDETTLINYWLEDGCNSTNTKIWARVPNIPAGGTTIYIYYGNPSVTGTGNADNVFDLFDDFSGTLGKWNSGGTSPPTISSGEVTMQFTTGVGNIPTSWLKSISAIPSDAVIETKAKVTITGGSDYGWWMKVAAVSDTEWSGGMEFRNENWQSIHGPGTPDFALTAGTYYYMQAFILGTNTDSYYSSSGFDKANFMGSGTLDANNGYAYLGRQATGFYGTAGIAWTVVLDSIRVRKYASPEPTLSVGAETLPSLSVSASPSSITSGVATLVQFTVTSEGAAVSGATVTLSGGAAGNCTTNASGQCSITITASSDVTATASKLGYTSGSAIITVACAPFCPGGCANVGQGDGCGGTCPNNTGNPCNDGNACTHTDTCNGGSCSGISYSCTPTECQATSTCNGLGGCTVTNKANGTACTADANQCTDDICNGGACTHPNDDTNPCDDGDACTNSDVCSGGSCAGTAITCDDSNVCTDDSCSPATGCVFTNNTSSCDDSNACTGGDTCGGGSCVAGPVIICDDSNICTDDSCSPATGCVFANNVDPCDDGDACTLSDVCTGGNCIGTFYCPACTISASPSAIDAGDSSTLSWNITNAISATINVGAPNLSLPSGSRSVSPLTTTTYVITATGVAGVDTCSKTLIVIGGTIPTKSIPDAIMDAVRWSLGIAVSLAVVVLTIAGISYMGSSGDANKTRIAKGLVKYTLMGLLVCGISYAIIVVLDRIF